MKQGDRQTASERREDCGVTLKDIQSIDYSWGEIDFEYRPMSRDLMLSECAPAMRCDMDIEPDDISVSDTVTVVWEIA